MMKFLKLSLKMNQFPGQDIMKRDNRDVFGEVPFPVGL